MKKKILMLLTAFGTAACLLVSCGPEPGREESSDADVPMMEEEVSAEDPGPGAGKESTAGEGSTAGEDEDPTAAVNESDAADTAGTAATDSGPAKEYEEMEPLDSEALQQMEDYLNEDSSYGFLLSAYEKPEDIDLNEVFYSGAGYPREELSEKEKKRFMEKNSLEELYTGITRVTEDQVNDLLTRKAGITLEESSHPLEKWTHISRYKAYYHAHGDTNQRKVQCTDGWRQGDTCILHYQTADPQASDADPSESSDGNAAEATAYYKPTYEVLLRASGEDYLFCSNTFWVQKDLIEAQSYQAALDPVGEVFFAPFYPDTEADPQADVSFGIVKDGWLRQTLGEAEDGNIRKDLLFTGVDAVDFTDYNKDGFTDILTVCSYQRVDQNGNAKGTMQEARVYDGTEDGIVVLNREKTAEVNRDVEVPGITSVTEYLTGKSDGKSRTWKSWQEAYADHLKSLKQEEYKGYALIYLEEGRTPAFVQVGATSAKGATVVVYRNGKLEETWLNRQIFQYLERENLLYSASGIENLYYDTIYSIVGGRLQVSVQGHYGNRSFAHAQLDPNEEPVYQYYWDGGDVSPNGYRDGLGFVFDTSRAKTCGEEDLLTAEEMLEKLK